MTKEVAVLMGGSSAEREVSLDSGRACAAALREAGYKVREIELGKDALVVSSNERARCVAIILQTHTYSEEEDMKEELKLEMEKKRTRKKIRGAWVCSVHVASHCTRSSIPGL